MSRNDSNLSASKYQSDIVISITEAALNNQIVEYLARHPFDEFVMFYVVDWDDEKEVEVPRFYASMTEGLKACDGVDPFLPRSAKKSDKSPDQKKMLDELMTLDDAGFKYAFRAKPGIPRGLDEDDLNDLISVKYGQNEAILTLKFEYFEVVRFSAPKRRRPGYTELIEQTVDNPFEIKCELEFHETKFDESMVYLEKQTLNKVKELGDKGFSIEQLVFNFAQHSTRETLTIANLDPALTETISKQVEGAYIKHMRDNKQPVFGITSKPQKQDQGSFKIHEVSLLGSQYKPQSSDPKNLNAKLGTLNYRCAARPNTKIKSLTDFDWNWIDKSEIQGGQIPHGVATTSRETMQMYLDSMLLETVKDNCLKPAIEHKLVYVSTDRDGIKHYKSVWKLSLYRGNTPAPTPSKYVDAGSKVLGYHYSAEHSADGPEEFFGHLKNSCKSNYNMDVFVEGKEIKITQRLIIKTTSQKIRPSFLKNGDKTTTRVVDKTITDIFELVIDSNGKVLVKKNTSKSKVEDESQNIEGGFLHEFLSLFDSDQACKDEFTRSAKKMGGSYADSLKTLPLSELNNYVFPGGRVFAFKDVKFSKHQDLSSIITYMTPN